MYDGAIHADKLMMPDVELVIYKNKLGPIDSQQYWTPIYRSFEQWIPGLPEVSSSETPIYQ